MRSGAAAAVVIRRAGRADEPRPIARCDPQQAWPPRSRWTPAERDAFLAPSAPAGSPRSARTARTRRRCGSSGTAACLWLYSIIAQPALGGSADATRASASVVDAGDDYLELRGVEITGRVEVVGEVPRTGEPMTHLAPGRGRGSFAPSTGAGARTFVLRRPARLAAGAPDQDRQLGLPQDPAMIMHRRLSARACMTIGVGQPNSTPWASGRSVRVVHRVGGAAHVGLPGVRAGLAAAAGLFLAAERAADLRAGRADVDVGDAAVGPVGGR